MIDVVEILEHWYSGRTKLVVAESLGLDRKTVRKYVAPAEAAGFVPGGPAVTTEQWVVLAQEWFPELLVPELPKAGFARYQRRAGYALRQDGHGLSRTGSSENSST